MPKEPWLKKRAVAALLSAADDARRGVTALPGGPICAHDETSPALRTDLVQYYRCPRCGYVWSRPHADADSAPTTA